MKLDHRVKSIFLALAAALALAACKPEQTTTEPKPAAADTKAPTASDAETMAAAEAAAEASKNPASAAAAAATPDAAKSAEQTPAASGPIPGLNAGTDYEEIPNGQPFEPLNGKIEIVEVFNFVCPACAGFQPTLLGWKKTLPGSVRFTYVPAAFGGNWDQFVRAFYTAQSMGIEEKAHEAAYEAIHVKRTLKGERGDDSDEDIAKFYGQFGADPKIFASSMRSFAVSAKFNKAKQFIIDARISSTPTLIINGKYKIRGRSADDVLRIATVLVAHEQSKAPAQP